VIAGTATATSNAVNRRQASKNVAAYGNAQQQYAQQTQAPPPPVAVGAGPSPAMVVTPPTPADMDDKLAQLERLAQLHAQGILDDQEFANEKAKILNS
jgi:type II secretory pathway pseudopilin PulG